MRTDTKVAVGPLSPHARSGSPSAMARWAGSVVVVLVACSLAMSAETAATPLPFNTSTWAGNHWCYNVNQGGWFPTVSSEQTTASFTDPLRDYCWTEIRTSAYIGTNQTVVFDVRPLLQSGGTNPDSAWFGFGPTWFSCCASDLRTNGWFSGVGFEAGKIWTAKFYNRGGTDYGTEIAQIGTYVPGQWLAVRLTPVAAGVRVQIGSIATVVPWEVQTDATPKRFIAVAADSVDGITMRSAAIEQSIPLSTAQLTNFADQWWIPAESGWGASVLQQGDILFIDLFVYGTDGKPTWFTAAATYQTNSPTTHSVFTGDLYLTNGPFYGGPFNSAAVTYTKVGTLTFDADSSTTARLTYTVSGVSVAKNVTRQTWKHESLAGVYAGGVSFDTTSCTVSSDNRHTEWFGVFVVAHDKATNVVTMTGQGGENGVNEGTMIFSGTYAQSGHMGRINGYLQLLPGEPAPVEMADIEVTHNGMTYHFWAQGVFSGCRAYGRVAVARS